jgi:hypothetical protein
MLEAMFWNGIQYAKSLHRFLERMLSAERTLNFVNLEPLGYVPIPQTFSMRFHFAGLADKWSSSCFELNETDVTSGFFCFFGLTLLLLIVDDWHFLYTLNKLCGR